MCGSGFILKKIRVGRLDTFFFETFFLGIYKPVGINVLNKIKQV